jgi:hypothetical protein
VNHSHKVADQDDCGQRGYDLQHEHNRILGERARVELYESLTDRRYGNFGVEQRRNRHAFAHF